MLTTKMELWNEGSMSILIGQGSCYSMQAFDGPILLVSTSFPLQWWRVPFKKTQYQDLVDCQETTNGSETKKLLTWVTSTTLVVQCTSWTTGFRPGKRSHAGPHECKLESMLGTPHNIPGTWLWCWTQKHFTSLMTSLQLWTTSKTTWSHPTGRNSAPTTVKGK